MFLNRDGRFELLIDANDKAYCAQIDQFLRDKLRHRPTHLKINALSKTGRNASPDFGQCHPAFLQEPKGQAAVLHRLAL